MDKFQELAPRIINDLVRDLGLKPFQAAAIVGNFGVETGRFKFMQEIKPVVAGSKGGYGWAQWTGARRRSFETWAKNHFYEVNSYDANYSFLIRELKGTEARALELLRTTRNVDEATISFMRNFERPGVPHVELRIKYAKEALGYVVPVAETNTSGAVIVGGAAATLASPVYAWPYIIAGTVVLAIVAWIAVSIYKRRKRTHELVDGKVSGS